MLLLHSVRSSVQAMNRADKVCPQQQFHLLGGHLRKLTADIDPRIGHKNVQMLMLGQKVVKKAVLCLFVSDVYHVALTASSAAANPRAGLLNSLL